jgi:hypothetical protein
VIWIRTTVMKGFFGLPQNDKNAGNIAIDKV